MLPTLVPFQLFVWGILSAYALGPKGCVHAEDKACVPISYFLMGKYTNEHILTSTYLGRTLHMPRPPAHLQHLSQQRQRPRSMSHRTDRIRQGLFNFFSEGNFSFP